MDQPKRKIREVMLELLRPGPAHNQLLSPLTPYIALCGADGPFTVHIPFEHQKLLSRLQRLRYEVDGKEVARSQREAELLELGHDIGEMLAKIPSAMSALGASSQQSDDFVHLRLSLSGSELGLIPFEAAIAPGGVPGSGAPLFLRAGAPITLTREVRRAQPLPVEWNRKPRILFAFACPDGYPEIPAQAHLDALRRALEPWVPIREDADDRLAKVKELLTVLPHASLDAIRTVCASTEFTHVHILAHGAKFPRAGDERYGIGLCRASDSCEEHIVGGDELALAIMGRDSSGRSKRWPTLVSLATCDSGAQGSVLTPGGSLAHEIHFAGIPWVIASQFPLWMRASSVAVESLYSGLLAGNDPRWVLHELRQRLRTECSETHDWASIIAYVAIPEGFDSQVSAFRARQTKAKIDVRFARMDDLVKLISQPGDEGGVDQGRRDEIKQLCGLIRADMKAWTEDPDAGSSASERAERLGMSASSEKRIAIIHQMVGDEISLAESAKAYKEAREFYRRALDAEPTNHWVITQFVSLVVIPALAPDAAALADSVRQYRTWWIAARQLAEWQLGDQSELGRIWALGSLLELEFLGAVFDDDPRTAKTREDNLNRYSAEMLRMCENRHAFPIESTRRQFSRYLEQWPRPEWKSPAERIVQAFTRDSA